MIGRSLPGRVGAAADPDSGSVTVEAAIALTAVMIVFGTLIGGLLFALQQIHCVDAAREAARLVARGEQARAVDAARRIAPDADVDVEVDNEGITVRVRSRVAGGVVPFRAQATAFAVPEPDTQPVGPGP